MPAGLRPECRAQHWDIKQPQKLDTGFQDLIAIGDSSATARMVSACSASAKRSQKLARIKRRHGDLVTRQGKGPIPPVGDQTASLR